MDASKAAVDHTFKMEMKQSTKENVERLYRETRLFEPLITKDISTVVTEQGNHLEGLIYAVKTASSVENKLERDAEKYAEAKDESDTQFDAVKSLSKMKDLIRYTEICPHNDIVRTTRETIEKMTESGYVLSGTKNFYEHPFSSTGYKGIHLNFISPYGQEIELQVHSQESFDAKQKGHVLYEQMRSVSVRPEVKNRLRSEAFAIHGAVPDPPGIGQIKDYTLNKEKKNALLQERREATNVYSKMKQGDEEREETIAYRVQVNGKDALYGFEHTFPDGSVWACHCTPEDKGAHFYELTEKGEQVSDTQVKAHPFSIGSILIAANKQKAEHEKWMNLYFPDREVEADRGPVPIEKSNNNR